jgi:hypothetical protein
VYRVESDEFVQHQIDALPAQALAAFAELRTVLELAPWSGEPIKAEHPEEPVRVAVFGARGQGVVTYLILDEQRRVELLQLVWIDLLT